MHIILMAKDQVDKKILQIKNSVQVGKKGKGLLLINTKGYYY